MNCAACSAPAKRPTSESFLQILDEDSDGDPLYVCAPCVKEALVDYHGIEI